MKGGREESPEEEGAKVAVRLRIFQGSPKEGLQLLFCLIWEATRRLRAEV